MSPLQSHSHGHTTCVNDANCCSLGIMYTPLHIRRATKGFNRILGQKRRISVRKFRDQVFRWRVQTTRGSTLFSPSLLAPSFFYFTDRNSPLLSQNSVKNLRHPPYMKTVFTQATNKMTRKAGQPSFMMKTSLIRPDLMALATIAIALYLFKGAYAGFVCNLCTALPAILLTSDIRDLNTISQDVAHCLLVYWALFGAWAPLDYLCSDLLGYFLIKFVVLLTSFYCVYSRVVKQFADLEPVPSPKVYSNLPQSGGDHTIEEEHYASSFSTDSPELDQEIVASSKKCTEASFCACPGSHAYAPECALEDESIALSVLTSPTQERGASFQIHNKTQFHIMWQLKTNSNKHVLALPGRGILAPGQVRKVCIEVYAGIGRRRLQVVVEVMGEGCDKPNRVLAFDCIKLKQTLCEFDRAVMNANTAHRIRKYISMQT